MTSLGRRWPTAIAIASSTSSARRWFAIAQPTILRLQASSTTTFSDEIGGVGGAADMTDFDPRARDIRQLDLNRLGVEARQVVFDRAQGLQHLRSQKLLGPPLRLGNRQHPAAPWRWPAADASPLC